MQLGIMIIKSVRSVVYAEIVPPYGLLQIKGVSRYVNPYQGSQRNVYSGVSVWLELSVVNHNIYLAILGQCERMSDVR